MYKIFTDTSANLPAAMVSKYDLGVVPLHYTIDGREYSALGENGVVFDGKAFFDSMRKGAIVQTSMVNVAAFYDAFEESLSAGMDVLCVALSGGVSGTCHSAATAAEELRERYPERKIAVVDTRAASLAEGLLVWYAAQLKEGGASLEDAAARTAEKSDFVCQYFTVEDLVYLKRGGRISGAAAMLGNILQIKPILMGNDEGKIVLRGKALGRKKALEALVKTYQNLVLDKDAPLGVVHADCAEDAEHLAGQLREAGCRGEILVSCFEPVTGSHVGPGAVAIFFYGIHR